MTNDPHKPDDSGVLSIIGGFFVAFGRGLVSELGVSLRWALWGAIIGALLLGGAGFWYFSWQGLGYGLLAGAVIGGVGAWLFYLFASSY